MILALDQATVLGWSACEPGCEPIWGHTRLGKRDAWEGNVYFVLRNILLDRIGTLKATHLAFEAPFVPFPNRSEAAKPFNLNMVRRSYGLVAHIVEIAEEFNLHCLEVQTTEAVKLFTGKGRYSGDTQQQRSAAKKQATVDACIARGWQVTHDEADALAILMFAERHFYPEISLRRRMVLKQPKGPLFSSP